ncbi:AAA family ATPase [Methanosarcina sp. KYL-1]|uniref:nuclease-related domain-containing DEAD/DEAH box helicase n=1 Tax=Methanosarcina sp. KYL-1 TaxID=2602068 RepID=UPI002100D22B|nr:UvrD-helicase domain-containing protein [Methanosarcina sp. KYL-1]MCQ1534867.1 AAA family ATPase [Methanosarcina sp. KYL-1]
MSLNVIPSNYFELTRGEERVANKIRSLYHKIDRECYLYVQPRLRELNPDFILIDSYKGVCIIEVKDWILNRMEKMNRVEVTFKSGKCGENPVAKTNEYFNCAKDLFEKYQVLLDETGALKFKVYSRVIFTSIDSGEIDASDLNTVLYQPPTRCLTSDRLRNLAIEDLFGTETSYLGSVTTSVIRAALFPEIKIQSRQHQLLEFDDELAEIRNTIKALDSEQEKFAKRIPYGHYMVSGVPGSGKTVILLARAIFLLKEHPDWKIKIITFNRSLANRMKNRFKALYNDLHLMGLHYENISISTFHKLAMDTACVAAPLNPGPDFWEKELPQKALEKARPKYDSILIDEYQDFYDDWLKLCLALCKKREYNGIVSENLFLAGDRLQSIYNPNEHTWKSLGVNIMGRSKLLKHSYRSGKSHIDLALDFLMSDGSMKREVEKFYEGREGIENEQASENYIEFLEGDREAINALLNELLLELKYDPEEVLVLVPTNAEAERLYFGLDPFLKSKSLVTKDIVPGKVIITTYHSSKGLECKACVLINVNRIRDKKLLYVGMTRASQRLYIHASDFESESFARQLKYGEFEQGNS